MADGVSLRVEGARELRATMRRAGIDLSDLTDANAAVAMLIATAATSGAPRRTGRLAGSNRPNRAKTKAVVRAGGAGVPYANAIHWGVGPRAGLRGPHNIRRRPWIWDAANAKQDQVIDLYWTKVQQAIWKIRGA